MLNCSKETSAPADFCIQGIHHIFMYPTVNHQPFLKPTTQMLELIEEVKQTNPELLPFLKNATNFFIGSFRKNQSHQINTYIISKTEYEGLTNLQNFVGTEALTAKHALIKRKTQPVLRHTSQNHLAIIQNARAIFLQGIFSLRQFLNFEISSANTDGYVAVSNEKLLPYPNNTPAVFFLDSWLKSELTETDIEQYIHLKEKQFENVFVCNNHKKEYAIMLRQKQIFTLRKCCLNNNQPKKFPAFLQKVENFGSYAAVFAVNKNVTFQQHTNVSTIKASGTSDASAEKLFSKCPVEISKLFYDVM